MIKSLGNLKKSSGYYEVICPKCLSRIKFDDEMRPYLLSQEKQYLDPETQELKDGGCPAIVGKNGETCGYIFPLRYLENSSKAKPMFIQVFGWPNHGKTVYLDVLRLMLFDMRTFWPNFVHQSLTEKDMKYDQILRRYQLNGYVAGSTRVASRAQNEVYILQLDHMERWGSRSLVVMDHSGERFSNFNVPVDEIPFLRNTPTAFMLVSLPEIFKAGEGQAMDQLLNIYIETMTRIESEARTSQARSRGADKRGNTLKRKLVVVLTMADIIKHLPTHLRNYVVTDDTWSKLRSKHVHPMDEMAMSEYIERMAWVSDEIREWLMRDSVGAPGGNNFVGLVESQGFEVRYTLISATGHDEVKFRPETEGIKNKDAKEEMDGIQIMPRRVLDPFYWALEFQSK